MTALHVRNAEAGDLELLAALLADAHAARRGGGPLGLHEVMAHPHLARFLDGWPLEDDAGVVGELGEPVGAAWYRRPRTREDGFLSSAIPVVTVAIRPEHRGMGHGAALLRALTDRARAEGVRALSLVADTDHPFIATYRRLGFVQVGAHEGGITLLLELS